MYDPRKSVVTPDRSAFSRVSVLVLYAAGFLQGLTLVSIPALSATLKDTLAISDARYGALFLPQVGCTALAAIFGGLLARRLGLKRLLWSSLLANALSQLAVGVSGYLADAMAFAALLAGTAALGVGFGVSSAPLNSYPQIVFPRHRDAALVALHTAVGMGLAAGPLIAAFFLGSGRWQHFPLSLSLASIVLACMAMMLRLPAQSEPRGAATGSRLLRTPLFWVFVAIAVVYALAEGTFSNWAVIYLREDRGFPAVVAAAGLAVFWAALAFGRLVGSALLLRVPPVLVWTALPVLMMMAFLLLPLARSPAGGIAAFAFAGMACSSFFPLAISRASASFPAEIALVSSAMIASLMLGIGLGTFVVAPLRSALPLADLYRYSAIYPLVVLALALLTMRLQRSRPSN